MKSATAALVVLGIALAAAPTLATAGEPPPAPASAATTQPAAPPAAQPTAQPAAQSAAPPAAPPGAKPGADMMARMTTYYVAFLRRSPTWTAGGAGAEELMKGHMANMQRLAKEGKLVLAGPFLEQTGPGSLAGLFFLRAGSLAEAQNLVDTDPAVQAGRFTREIVPWLGPKVLARLPQMFDEDH
jgi:uncharacterized protein YciI